MNIGSVFFKLFLTIAAAYVMYHHEAWAQSSCAYQENDPLYSRYQACQKIGGRQWNCTLNLCTTPAHTAETQSEITKCDDIENAQDANQCRLEVAREMAEREQQISLEQTRLKAKNTFGMTLSSAIGVFYIFSNYSKDFTKGCSSAASKLLGAAGAVSILGSLLSEQQYRKDLKRLNKQYETLIAQENGINAQVEAFEYLAQQQNKLGKASERFEKTHKVAGGLFSAAAIVAAIALTTGQDGACKPTNDNVPSNNIEKKPSQFTELQHIQHEFLKAHEKISFLSGKNQGLSLDDYESFENEYLLLEKTPGFKEALLGYVQLISNIIIPNSYALFGISSREASQIGGATLGMLLAYDKFPAGWGQKISTNAGMVAMGAVGASLAFMTSDAYGSQANHAFAREKAVREMRDALDERLGYSECPERNDPRKPQCYCMLPNRVMNESRSHSRACQLYWFGTVEQVQDPNNYNRSNPGDEQVRGCINRQGQYQPNCECRSRRYRSGADNCMQANINKAFSTIGIGGISTGGTTSLSRNATQLLNGSLGLSNLTAGKAGQAAFKLKESLKKVLDTQDKKLRSKGKKGFALTDKNLKSATRSFLKDLNNQGRKLASSFSPQLEQPQGGLGEKALKAISEASKKSGVDPFQAPNRSKGESLSDFMAFESGSKRTKRNILEFKKQKNYDYKGNDISKDAGQSIFEILTYRYHNTALEKLFSQ